MARMCFRPRWFPACWRVKCHACSGHLRKRDAAAWRQQLFVLPQSPASRTRTRRIGEQEPNPPLPTLHRNRRLSLRTLCRSHPPNCRLRIRTSRLLLHLATKRIQALGHNRMGQENNTNEVRRWRWPPAYFFSFFLMAANLWKFWYLEL